MQDLELDKKILSYALKEKKFTMELTSSITEKYFGPELQWLFRTLNQHFTDPKFKEIPTENVIREYASKLYQEQEDIEACVKDYTDVMAVEIVPSEFHWHLDKLRVRYNAQVGKECALSIHKVFKTETDEKERIEKVNKIMRESVVSVDSIYRKQSYREGSLDESAKERAARYKHIEENPDSARGILTGFKEFDRITNGLHKGELMIVAGSTGTGKSVVMHNIGVNAYLGGNSPFTPPETWTGLGHNVLYFSLEMPKESMERRIDSCMAGIYYNQIRDGVLAQEVSDAIPETLSHHRYAKGRNYERNRIKISRNM
jgi:ABC-type glutathione transport system ATPase component